MQTAAPTLRQQAIEHLHAELALLTTFDYGDDELTDAGWGELLTQHRSVLPQMRAQIVAAGLSEPA